jgi:hypothetical protein
LPFTRALVSSLATTSLAAHLCRDPLGRLGDGFADAGEHVGDGPLRDGQAEQALADLGQPLVADHLAAVQVRDHRRDARTEWRAFGHVGGRARRHPRLAARACGAEQLDARRNRPDRRNVDMVVLFGELLPGLAECGTAHTALGIEASCRVRGLGELACNAGPVLARRFACWRRLGIRLLPARRRQRGVVPGLGRPPSLASSSAMRAFSAFACASSSSMRSSLAPICARS